MKILQSGYDVTAVRHMMSEAMGKPMTDLDIYNLSRPGYVLHGAKKRQGFYIKGKTSRIIRRVLLRRLASELGRTSPRLLPEKGHETKCPQCRSIAVLWEGRTRCEKGHTHGQ